MLQRSLSLCSGLILIGSLLLMTACGSGSAGNSASNETPTPETTPEPEPELAPVWIPYDESADLAELAQHENPLMRFSLINSKILNKNDLWAPFLEQLSDFGGDKYEMLKPLVLEQSISSIQQSVAAGIFSYEELTTFYIYRIRRIETDDSRFINAVISLNPDAISRARRLDELRIVCWRMTL